MLVRSFPKAGIYFSHYECFGHTSRVMAVGEVFKKRFPQGDLFFIQAGVQQPKAKIDLLGRVYSLPEAFMDRGHFREMTRKTGSGQNLRSAICQDIILKEKPDIFITEFFPLGWEECRYELIPSLIKAAEQENSIWAIAGYPLLIGTNDGWREKILKLYKQIIIFSPEVERDFFAGSFTDMKQKKRYLEFFDRHAKKFKFAGYLLPRQEVVRDDEDENQPKPPVPKGACRVAVIRGGGAVYPKVIAQAIRASDLLGEEYFLTVVAGPSTSKQEWYLFNTLVSEKKIKNLILLRSLGNYEGLIKECDVCVALASYHTSVMLLKYTKKAVLIPFEGYGEKLIFEQSARAGLLKEMIGASVLSIHDLTAETMAEAIKKISLCGKITSHIPKEWFGGEDFLDKQLMGIVP